MLQIVRTNVSNSDFISLIKLLDAELAIRDGEDHSFYNQFNKLDSIKEVVLIYDNEQAVACGAIKVFNKETMEVKRMFVLESYRGRGIASIVLEELEKWAVEIGYQRCILETGYNQPEALRLYTKAGYTIISNYGQYAGIKTSVCFEKKLG
jgi:putative acetyltransferase